MEEIYSDTIRVRLKRTRYLIEIENPDVSVTFHPNDIDKTHHAIISKCNELYSDYSLTDMQLRDIDAQLTEIYNDYSEERDKHIISDADHLVYLAKSQFKEQFKDQTGAFYAVIEKDDHDETLKIGSTEFDRYLSRLFYESEVKNKVISTYTINNSKRLLESFTNKTKTLYHREQKLMIQSIMI